MQDHDTWRWESMFWLMRDTNMWLRYWSMGCQLSPSGNWMAYTDIQKRQKAAGVLPLKKTMDYDKYR
jgi:hypothetical protein